MVNQFDIVERAVGHVAARLKQDVYRPTSRQTVAVCLNSSRRYMAAPYIEL